MLRHLFLSRRCPMPRVLVRFSKRGPLRFISHLDTVELFKKALRRADIPAAYSLGLTPQVRMSILHPLPVGTESEGEYLNLETAKAFHPEELAEKLAAKLPEGIEILMVRPVSRKLSFPRFDFHYRVEVEDAEAPGEERIRELLGRERVEILRRKKGKERVDDVRPFLKEIERDAEGGLRMRIASIEGRTVRPEEVLGLLCEDDPSKAPPCRVVKTETTYGDR